MFDYAECPKPKPSLPTFPEDDHSWHFFCGADGNVVIYNGNIPNSPWRVEGSWLWFSGEQLIAEHPEVFPISEINE